MNMNLYSYKKKRKKLCKYKGNNGDKMTVFSDIKFRGVIVYFILCVL